jgi:hypothetical protein
VANEAIVAVVGANTAGGSSAARKKNAGGSRDQLQILVCPDEQIVGLLHVILQFHKMYCVLRSNIYI